MIRTPSTPERPCTRDPTRTTSSEDAMRKNVDGTRAVLRRRAARRWRIVACSLLLLMYWKKATVGIWFATVLAVLQLSLLLFLVFG